MTFTGEKQDCVWVDWRTLTTLAMMGLGDPCTDAADEAGRRLQEVLELPIVYRGKHHEQSFAFADPPQWGDAKKYFAEMARCEITSALGHRGSRARVGRRGFGRMHVYRAGGQGVSPAVVPSALFVRRHCGDA